MLSAVLKVERSDVDSLRSQALRMQGEQQVKIRELEECLLEKISAVQGAILDDDSVIIALETIKAEAADVEKEVMETRKVMDDVKAISSYYEPLASAMAAVYFSMERLADVNFLYQFSLNFFINLINDVLTKGRAQVPLTRSTTFLELLPNHQWSFYKYVVHLDLSFFSSIL